MKIVITIIIIFCSMSYGAEPILLKPAKNEVITDRVKINAIVPDSIEIGKPIIIKLILENVGQDRIVYRYSEILNDFSIYIYYKGQKIKLSDSGWNNKNKIARSFSKNIDPKRKVNRTVDLDKFFNIHDVGNYTMDIIFRWGKGNREKTTIKSIKFEVKDTLNEKL